MVHKYIIKFSKSKLKKVQHFVKKSLIVKKKTNLYYIETKNPITT